MSGESHAKDRLIGLLSILVVGLPIVGMTTWALNTVEAAGGGVAIVLTGYPTLEYWLMEAIRLIGIFLILSGMMWMFFPEKIED